MSGKKYFDLAEDNPEHSLYFYGTEKEFSEYKMTGEHKIISEDQSFQYERPKKINAIIGPKN